MVIPLVDGGFSGLIEGATDGRGEGEGEGEVEGCCEVEWVKAGGTGKAPSI